MAFHQHRVFLLILSHLRHFLFFFNYVVFCFGSWKEILVIRIYSNERRKKNISDKETIYIWKKTSITGIYYIRVIIDVYNGCSDKGGSTTSPILKLKIFGGKHGSTSDLYRTFGFRNCWRSILCRLSIIE